MDFDFDKIFDEGENPVEKLTPRDRRAMKKMDEDKNKTRSMKQIPLDEWHAMPLEEKRRVASEELAKMVDRWDGDSQDEEAFRSMVAGLNMILNTMLALDPNDCSETMVAAMSDCYTTIITTLKKLDMMKAFYPHMFKID